MRKPRLSGAARRKLKRQQDAQTRLEVQGRLGGAAVKPLSPELLPPLNVDDLDSVGAYRRELNRVYGQMRIGAMLPETGTKLAFVLCQGAGLARIEAKLLEAEAIRRELIKLNTAAGNSAVITRLPSGSNGRAEHMQTSALEPS